MATVEPPFPNIIVIAPEQGQSASTEHRERLTQ